MKLVPYEIIHMFMTSNTGIPLHYIYFLRCYIHIISSLIVASKTRTWFLTDYAELVVKSFANQIQS